MPFVEATALPVRSRGSAVALALATVLLAGIAAWHLSLVFLTLAPPNGVSEKYRSRIDAHVQPEFKQDWKLFGPEIIESNIEVDARVRTAGDAGDGGVGPWVDLAAQDIAHIRGNPVASYADQRVLRSTWKLQKYVSRGDGSPVTLRERLIAQYLKRIALQRIGREWHGERVVALQMRSRFTPVPPPRWKRHDAATRKRDPEVLPWWRVKSNDYKGLGI